MVSTEHIFAYVKNIVERMFVILWEFWFLMLYDHVADIFTGYMLPVIVSYILDFKIKKPLTCICLICVVVVYILEI